MTTVFIDGIDEHEVNSYKAWLQYSGKSSSDYTRQITPLISNIVVEEDSLILKSAKEELVQAISSMFGISPKVTKKKETDKALILTTALTELPNNSDYTVSNEGFRIETVNNQEIYIAGKTDQGILYGVYHILRLLQMEESIVDLSIYENPVNQVRMVNHWDNIDGSIERGYAGKSIFFKDNQFRKNFTRLKDYARLLASVGINSVSINNVNVHQVESKLITHDYLPDVKRVAAIFRAYGVSTYLSVNYASPIEIGGIDTADPLDNRVKDFWKQAAETIYSYIPDFGGFVVKADSENRPGPFTYDRNHAEGSNMLAEALEPFGGHVVWRCFVYNCKQDWRDRVTDRARAAYDHFMPLDGEFKDNVILQIKNGPMDFQVREPVSPLIGGLKNTNQFIEFQITQEYLGQQKHLAYLIPQWKEVMEFDTYSEGENSTVKKIVSGVLLNQKISGVAAVTNIGDDHNWTGHTLAQANFYGYGRLTWNSDISSEQIADEWIRCTFGNIEQIKSIVSKMLMNSWEVYENYTSPLGVGWMVNPNHHYGPNIDGYEYQAWGTYHFADRDGIGVDRTVETGTGYSGQYFSPCAEVYESLEQCPDELILFFHHVPYTHQLHSGKTVIQHIYDTHFLGVEQALGMVNQWKELEGTMDITRYEEVLDRLKGQYEHSKEWRDIINTYFYRKSGIDDKHKRKIY
ncbi:alpha-glucuronidase family glycosyl hydrolase [Salipaludibacillus sp. HK11]|uniref:alpha-glucuronidase family glycosyl hydrolase n=1 Tax=Salipaludibacillus sp. HK11 TaxID=3394320 RepID=UPI0039FC633A